MRGAFRCWPARRGRRRPAPPFRRAERRARRTAVRRGTLTLPTYEEDLPDVNPRFDLFARRPFLIYPYTARTNLTDRRAEPDLAHARARERVPEARRAARPRRTHLQLRRQGDRRRDVLREPVDQVRRRRVPRGVGGARGRVQLPRLAQLDDGLAGGLRHRAPRGRQRVRLGRQRSTARTGCSGGSSSGCAPAARCSSRRRRSTTAATCATASTGGRRPRSAPRATRTSSTRWSSRPPTTSPTSTPGRWTPRASTSPTRATTSRASCRASSTAAASRSWASTTRRRSRGWCTSRTTTTCRARRSGPGAGTTRARTGAAPSPTTRAPTSRSRPGLFRNQETYAFLEPQQLLRFRETYQPVRKIGGYSRANDEGVVHVRRGEGNALRVGLNLTRAVRGGRVVIRAGTATVREEALSLAPSGVFDATYADLAAPGPYTVEVRDADRPRAPRPHRGPLRRRAEGGGEDRPAAGPRLPAAREAERGRLGGARPPPGAEREAARGPRRLRGGARGVSREPGAQPGRGTPRRPAQALRRGRSSPCRGPWRGRATTPRPSTTSASPSSPSARRRRPASPGTRPRRSRAGAPRRCCSSDGSPPARGQVLLARAPFKT